MTNQLLHKVKLFSFALLLFVSTSAPGFDMGPLNQYLEEGSNGSWNLMDDQGSVVLENSSMQGDITYYFVNAKNGEGHRDISARVTVESQNGGRAGLLYGFLQNPRSYFLYTTDGYGDASLHFLGPDGFEQVASFEIARGTVTLSIREKTNGIALYANEEELQVMYSDRFGHGGVGIVAANIGQFRLSNFQISNKSDIQLKNSTANKDGKEKKLNNSAIHAVSSDCVKEMQYQDLRDQNTGVVMMQLPMPSGWKFVPKNPDQLYISGPGVSIYSYSVGSFVWGKTQFANQSARQQNMRQVVEPMSLEQYLARQIVPTMQDNGYRLANSEELPRIESFLELFSMSMPQLGGIRRYEAIGTEWENQDGARLFKLLVLTLIDRHELVIWDVRAGDVYTSETDFNFARDSYICSYAETKINADWQIQKNEELIREIRRNAAMSNQRMAQSAVAHAQRMKAIAVRGETAKSIGDTYSDILDINQSGYLKRSDMISAGQGKFTDYSAGNTLIHSPETGERFKVESGNNYYWINNQGEYFGTDNPNLDPRSDRRFENTIWTSTEIVR